MKNIRLVLIIILSSIFISEGIAQKIGVKAGFNYTNQIHKYDNGGKGVNRFIPGFQVGPLLEVDINDYLTTEGAFLFTTKGFSTQGDIIDAEGIQTQMHTRTDLYYLDIPVQIKFKYPVGNSKLVGALGPQFGYGLYGKFFYETITNNNIEGTTSDISWNEESSDALKRIDYGIIGSLGADIRAFNISLNYNLTLNDIAAEDQNHSIRNEVISLSVSYKFIEL